MSDLKDVVFRKIELSDKGWIKERLAEDNNSFYESSFAVMYLYRKLFETEIAQIEGCCVFRCKYSSMKESVPYWTYSFPMGSGDKKKALGLMMELCRQDGIPLNMNAISEEMRQQLMEFFPGKFFVEAKRDHFDYIYTHEKLAYLKGKKMQKKRNHIARFKDNPDWSYEELTDDNLAECAKMAEEWAKDCIRRDKLNKDVMDELGILQEAFNYFDDLDLVGGVLRQEGKIVAFTIGEPLNKDTFLVHFEKAFPTVQGAYPMINQQFMQHVSDEFVYINRMDDMGDPGLRKAKLSYRPDILLTKYMAETSDVVYAVKDQDHDAIVDIWQQCFHDSKEDIEVYLENRMTDDNMLVIRENGKAVSMMSFLPIELRVRCPFESDKLCSDTEYTADYDDEIGETVAGLYVYAVATLPEYQGRGYSRKIMKFAQKKWKKSLVLSPADDGLRCFYGRQEFKLFQEGIHYAFTMPKLPDENVVLARAQAVLKRFREGSVLPRDEYEVRPAQAGEYVAIRDASFGKIGYGQWDEAAMEYAIKHFALSKGEALLITRQSDEKQLIMLYDLRGCDKGVALRIRETNMPFHESLDFFPDLWKRVHELNPGIRVAEVQFDQPASMIWLPKHLRCTVARALVNNGYFNICLD
ncbi:MAG: GNAT family N-acetyltransferase [Anaerovibrio sp.]|nr:GNAT family N-acetyltransferase [Anaerovibrio sp.]